MIDGLVGATWTDLAVVVGSATAVFVLTIVYVRLVGLRSFSKMSGFDLIMTLAVGSIVGTVAVTPSLSVVDGAVGIGTLFVVQLVIAVLRSRTRFERLVDNEPLLLMAGDRFLPDNLRRARATEGDVRAILRDANVLDRAQVRAVVLATTGAVSVLHGDGPLDLDLLEGVRGADQIVASPLMRPAAS